MIDKKSKVFGTKVEGISYTQREGAYGIHFDANQQVAVIKVKENYFLPGGGVEEAESYAECLRREFLEETGRDIEIICKVATLSQYHKSLKDDKYYKLIGNFYYVKMLDKRVEPIEVDHELTWLPMEEVVPMMLLDYQAEAIKRADMLRSTRYRQ